MRNEVLEDFFSRQALTLAEACREMAERFLRGGRLLALGRGSCSTDAQHVSVEFVHPVIVGKLSLARTRSLCPYAAMAGRNPSSRRYRDGIRTS